MYTGLFSYTYVDSPTLNKSIQLMQLQHPSMHCILQSRQSQSSHQGKEIFVPLPGNKPLLPQVGLLRPVLVILLVQVWMYLGRRV